MSMAKAIPAQARAEATWSSTQAYVLAVFCLLMGVALGYLFRGSASPAEQATAASPPAFTTKSMPQQQPLSPAQQKEVIERAAAPLLDTLKKEPTDFESLVKLGNLYYDGRQFAEAVPYYERALKIQPQNADVRTDLGTAVWYTGDADRAIAEFQKALKYRPGHPGTLFNLGVVRWQGKLDPKGAVEAWEELLRRNPDYPQKQQVQQFIEKAKQHAAKG